MSDSVALVVLDTLRKDSFDEHFSWLDGLSFQNALSPSHWTTPVHASIFAGAYSTEVGVHASNPTFNPDVATLAEKLSEAGWTCQGYSANGNVSPSANFDRGFDTFTAKGYHSESDIFDWGTFTAGAENSGWTRYLRAIKDVVQSDCDTVPSLYRGMRMKYDDVRYGGSPDLTVEDALEYVETEDFSDNEFLFVNLMEAHPSYSPPSEYQTVEPIFVNSIDALAATLCPDTHPVNDSQFRQTYEDSVRYLSEYYQKIHETLLDDFDYVITVSDHGESFGTDGIYGHIPSLLPQIVHVPLVISGDVENRNSATSVSLLDINQTISDIAGVEDPPRGQNLLEAESERYVSEAHGISQWQRKGLEQKDVPDDRLDTIENVRRGIALKEYYGYESLFDGWVHSRGNHPAPQEDLMDIVSTFSDLHSGSEQELSGEVRSQLQDMGYL